MTNITSRMTALARRSIVGGITAFTPRLWYGAMSGRRGSMMLLRLSALLAAFALAATLFALVPGGTQANADRDARIRAAIVNQETETAKYEADAVVEQTQLDYVVQQAAFDQGTSSRKAEAELAYELQSARTNQSVNTVHAAAATTHNVPHDWALIPSGLGVGDSFRLIFVTTTVTTATSGNINHYNTHVQNAVANSGHQAIRNFSGKFRAVVSTDAPSNAHARDNTGTTYTSSNLGVPIYWLGGAKVADNYQDFYDGSWDSIAGKHQNGSNVQYMGPAQSNATKIWTGSKEDGTRWFAAGGNSGKVTIGILWSERNNIKTLRFGQSPNINAGRKLYGLSPVITVVGPVPQAPAQPTIAWGPTRNSVRIEFPPNSHNQHEYIFSYSIQMSRQEPDNTWTPFGWVAAVGHGTGTRTKIVTGLNPNTNYQVKVAARSRVTTGGTIFYGPSSTVRAFSTLGADRPDPPTSLRAHQVYYNRVEVRWNAPTHVGGGPIQRYTISARHKIGNNWTNWGWAANAGSGARSHTVTGYCDVGGHSSCPAGSFVNFVPWQTYQIRVSARNRVGNSPRDGSWTEPVEIRTISPVPHAPNPPRVSERTNTTVRVSWDSLTNDGAHHIYNWGIDRRHADNSDDGFSNWIRRDVGANVRTVVLTGLLANKAHQVRVMARARTVSGGRIYYAPASEWTDFMTRGATPSAPAPPVLSNPQTLPQRVDVSWSLPEWTGTTTISDYSLQVLVGGAWKASHPEATGATSLTLRGWLDSGGTVHDLEPGTEYRVRVAAENDAGAGPYSDASTFLETLPGAPNAPAAPTITQLVANQVSVSWSAPSPYTGATPITGYDLRVFHDGSWHSAIPAGSGTGTSRVIRGYETGGRSVNFSPDTEYRINVRAKNREQGTSNVRLGAWSPDATFRTGAGGPPGLQAVPTGGGAHLFWSAPTGAGPNDISHYGVEYTTQRNFSGVSSVEAVAVHGIQVAGDWALNPYRTDADQGAGRTFRLLFLTSGTRNAVSSDIADYNSFVQTQANGGHTDIQPFSGQFTALASTAAVDARDNTATTQDVGYNGVPIHWLNGEKAADDYGDFYDGNWDSNAFRFQDGTAGTSALVWTGSTSEGVASADYPLGEDSNVMVGQAHTQGQELAVGSPSDRNGTYGIYALSPLITVVTPNTPAVLSDGPNLIITGLTNNVETRFRVRPVRRSRGMDALGWWSQAATATPGEAVDYDADDDGLIEINTLAQLNAVRWDMRGRGEAATGHRFDYLAAFPVPMAGMGCPPVTGNTGGCSGYELTTDLDFDENDDRQFTSADSTYWNEGKGWLPIGDSVTDDSREVYTGVFHGNGHVIHLLTIDRDSNDGVGLFDGIGNGGVVRDLGLSNLITSFKGKSNVGVIAGLNSGTVLRCWTTGTVTSVGDTAGGLVGSNNAGGLIGESWSSADVNGASNVGGMVGINAGTIRGSYTTAGQVTASASSAGGLAGKNDSQGDVQRSWTSKAASGEDWVGGLVGHNEGSITASYATGTVTRTGSNGGGLVGFNEGGTITASYATGDISGTAGDDHNGLVGHNDGGTVTDSYWDTQTSGQASGGLGTGYTTAQLKAPTDYSGIYVNWNVDSADPWDFGSAQSYPALRSDLDGDGLATAAEFGLQRGPGPVTNLAAERDSNGDIVVTWGPPVSSGSGVFHTHKFHASTDNSAPSLLSNWSSNSRLFRTFTPAADVGYYVRVAVENRFMFTTRNFGPVTRIRPPSTPRQLKLYAYETALGMSWDAPPANPDAAGAGGITGYTVRYRTAAYCSDGTSSHPQSCAGAGETWTVAGAWDSVAWDAADGLAATIDDLTTNTEYQVQVAAVNALGRSGYQQAFETPVTTARAPSAPRDVTVLPKDGGLEIGWSPPQDLGNPGGVTFKVEYKLASDTDWTVDDHDGNAVADPSANPVGLTYHHVLSSLQNNQDYLVRVAASGGSGGTDLSPYSDEVRVTPGLRLPGAPRNLRVSPGDRSISATWDAPQDPGDPAMEGYIFQWRISGPGNWDGDVIINAASQRVTLLTNGVDYEVRAAAFHNSLLTHTPQAGVQVMYVLAAPQDAQICPTDGPATVNCYVVIADASIGAYTDPQTVTPDVERRPGVPQNLLLSPGDRAIFVSWDDPVDIGNPPLDGYVIHWRQPGQPWDYVVRDVNSALLDGLTNDVSYEVQVSAFHRTAPADIPGDVDVTYVLAIADVPQPEPGQPALLSCPTSGTLTVDCYVVIQSTNIGLPVGPANAIPVSDTTPAANPNAPRNLRLVPGAEQVIVEWGAPQQPSSNQVGYIVQYRSVDSTVWVDWQLIIDTAARSATITGLEVGTYEIRVGTLLAERGGYVLGGYSALKMVETQEPRMPGPPRDLQAVIRTSPNDGSRIMEVYWVAPADLGNPPGVASYSVQYRQVGDAAWTDWTQAPRATLEGFRVWITGIGSDDDWEVRVAAIGLLGHMGEYATTGKSQRRPGPIENLTLTPGDGQITAKWDPPDDPGYPPFQAYSVSIRAAGENVWERFQETGRTKTFTGLTNGRTYEVQVVISNGAGYGPSVTLSATPGGTPVTTKPDPDLPSAPRNLTVTAGNTWMVVEWDSPDFEGYPPLRGYFIRYRDVSTERHGVLRHDDLSINARTIDAGLSSDRHYQVSVEAYHIKDGKRRSGPAVGPVSVWTDSLLTNPPRYPERQPSAPRNLTLTPGDGTIEVTWDRPQRLFKNRPIYLVEYREDGSPSWTEAEETRGAGAFIDYLENGETYEVRVTVFDSYGEATAGPKRVTLEERSVTPPVPPAPAINQTLALTPGDGIISMSWDPHPSVPGNCYCYLVEYREADGNESWVENGWYDRSGGVIQRLWNGVEYEVRVLVINSRDQQLGVIGPERATPSKKPGRNTKRTREPSEPRNVQLAPGVGQIEVSWDLPLDRGVPEIEGYAVQYRKVGRHPWNCQWTTGAAVTLTGLENGRNYEVLVSAGYERCDGIAGPVRAAPGGDAAVRQGEDRSPWAPRNLLLMPDNRQIAASWDPPRRDDEHDGYAVQYRQAGARYWDCRWTTSTSRTLTGLRNDVEHEVLVSAGYVQCNGMAGPMRVTTEEPPRVPGPPRDLRAELGHYPNGRAYVQVSWSAPADEGYPRFDAYQLSLRVRTASGWGDWQHGPKRSRYDTSPQLGVSEGNLEYRIRVRALNDAGSGPIAGPVSVSTSQ